MPAPRHPARASGLVSLVWLANEATGRYGGFYIFEQKPSFDSFVASELYEALRSRHGIDGLTASDFSVDRVSTALTRGPVSEGSPA